MDQYRLAPEDYVDNLKSLSGKHYSQGMLFLVVLFLKQQLKPIKVIIATLIVYDFINCIPQQMRLFICK